jgi:uncharacterized protein (TIGR02452 family)
MVLKGIAEQTLAIIESGRYRSEAGLEVIIGSEIARAVDGTVLYRPGDYDGIQVNASERQPVRVEVTNETTTAAARRLIRDEGEQHVVALNFASAKNAGGGFLTGAKAQEEDITRCSALYKCLVKIPEYYEANRATSSMLYTDHIIYSPDVPFFRNDRLELLDEPYPLSIITSPAPNAGEHLRRKPHGAAEISETLRRRALQVLSVAAHHEHRTLILGAWGCGVFRNDPAEVALVFAEHLASPTFDGVFARIVFAVYDRSAEQSNFNAFAKQFRAAVAP